MTALFLWPQGGLAAKRLHDLNRRAWPFLVVYAGFVAFSFAPFDPFVHAGRLLSGEETVAPSIALMAVYFGVLFALFVWFVLIGFIDGTAGPNRFGPSPKTPDAG